MENCWAEKENADMKVTFNGVTVQCITALLSCPNNPNTSLDLLFFPVFFLWFSTTLPQIFHLKRCCQLTRIEMMPLNFSSTKSQIILLLKYWTGSHYKDKKSHLGENSSRLGKKHDNFRTFQTALYLKNLSVKLEAKLFHSFNLFS